MKLLAIETSTKHLGIIIRDEKSILSEYRDKMELRHSQDLIPRIDTLLKNLKLKLTDINAFAISIGPGSFTGLRVGVSTLKALNIVTQIPIVAVPTLDVIAENAAGEGRDICTVIDAKKGNLYTSLYKSRDGGIIRVWDYLLLNLGELAGRIEKETLFIGDGIDRYGTTIKALIKGVVFAEMNLWLPDVKVVADLGFDKLKRKEFTDPDTLVPMYIYSKECNVRGVER